MNLTKWYRDRKIWRLKEKLAQHKAELATLQCYGRDDGTIPYFMLNKILQHVAAIARIEAKLESLDDWS